ncbi:MAG TPA: hypothetical protein VG010_11055 [Solirubrobacteraceae bacterium]|jgi:hypothetical protein|nr:hypothetical protein [Solirubrobacteraceae bacterium]
MTTRDRIVLMVVVTLVALGGVWLLAVSPERKKASQLDTQVSAANAQLGTAESQLASARGAQASYSAAYASIVSLGKAVPAEQEVPSLVYQLDQAANHKHVDFNSIVLSAGGSAPSGSGAAGASPAAQATTFTQMPFTFVFNGSFVDLYDLFQQVNRFAERRPSGQLQVSGRLLTIDGVKLAPSGTAGQNAASQLTGTITATAYVLPAAQGLTAGATPAAPTGAGGQPASASSPASPTTPAIARVTP